MEIIYFKVVVVDVTAKTIEPIITVFYEWYYNESFVKCHLSLEKRLTMVEPKDNLNIIIFFDLRLPVNCVMESTLLVGLTRALYRLDHPSIPLLTFQEACVVVVDC